MDKNVHLHGTSLCVYCVCVFILHTRSNTHTYIMYTYRGAHNFLGPGLRGVALGAHYRVALRPQVVVISPSQGASGYQSISRPSCWYTIAI